MGQPVERVLVGLARPADRQARERGYLGNECAVLTDGNGVVLSGASFGGNFVPGRIPV